MGREREGGASALWPNQFMKFSPILIIFDVTGWHLAGLVSSVGNALIGTWLLSSNRLHQHGPEHFTSCG